MIEDMKVSWLSRQKPLIAYPKRRIIWVIIQGLGCSSLQIIRATEMIDFVTKSRLEQEADFQQIAFYADTNCKKCYGTGKEYWIQGFGQYKVCECVLKNVKELQKETVN